MFYQSRENEQLAKYNSHKMFMLHRKQTKLILINNFKLLLII